MAMYCYYPEQFTVLIGLEDQGHSMVSADVNIDIQLIIVHTPE